MMAVEVERSNVSQNKGTCNINKTSTFHGFKATVENQVDKQLNI